MILADDGETKRTKSDLPGLIEKFLKEDDRVRGNRTVSVGFEVKWSDLRYQLAATLRAALEELDRAGGISVVNLGGEP
jgi:hypothetical protein